MGGMAAQIPISGDPEANERALDRVRADKLREVSAGHDGTWVAHPALIPMAQRNIRCAACPARTSCTCCARMSRSARDELIRPSIGTITRGGFDNNVEVCVRYLAAWLDGQGCVPIHWLMEDAATAEISRAQLWQWLHHGSLSPGRRHAGRFRPVRSRAAGAAVASWPTACACRAVERIDEAIALLDELTHADELADFLTLSAYERID